MTTLVHVTTFYSNIFVHLNILQSIINTYVKFDRKLPTIIRYLQ